jgi:L-alanine-DL-glutamate epimerase-like enolase superfamily enzyme
VSRVSIKGVSLFFIRANMRVPLKFGAQVVTAATCARVRLEIEDVAGRRAVGWGETPLSVAWVWPSTSLTWESRENALMEFCIKAARKIGEFEIRSHPMDLCRDVVESLAPDDVEMPLLARLCCLSPFDLAAFDAVATIEGRPAFAMFDIDLERFLGKSFRGRTAASFLRPRETSVPVWHLVGGLDPLDVSDLDGTEPDDGYPVLLRDWIRRDGLRCLKIKLRGTDAAWDFDRLERVGRMALDEGCEWLSADFNCTVTEPAYVCEVIDRLEREHPALHRMLLYIEQPFPYDLHAHPIDVRAVSARKPLFLDESAHDWRHVAFGRELGWTGVALKTCKTLSGAILSLCWARAHDMSLMVQDLTNPMLALIPHVSLAAHAGTIMGVECNAMQFYPEASLPEESIHPGLYRRRNGRLDPSTLGPVGFGYRIDEIPRRLPEPAWQS